MLHAWRAAESLSARLFTHITAEALPKCVHFIFAQNLHKILSCLGATPAAIGMKYYSTSFVAEEIFSFEIVNLMLKIIAEATTSIGRLNHWEISSATHFWYEKASFFGEKTSEANEGRKGTKCKKTSRLLELFLLPRLLHNNKKETLSGRRINNV